MRQGGQGDKEEMGKESIKSHEDLVVYKMAFEAAMKIFNLSKTFPVSEYPNSC